MECNGKSLTSPTSPIVAALSGVSKSGYQERALGGIHLVEYAYDPTNNRSGRK
jgi:hypothetical protein